MAEDVYKGNPYEYEFTLVKKATANSAATPASGINDLVALMSATPGGATINAGLSTPLAERSGKPGTYFAIVPAAVIDAQLFGVAPANYDGQAIYVCCRGADVNVADKVKVRSVRKSV